ncbi:MAG: 16S rRNA (guanine(966)-N(2))-methyltransferase RsmD [Lachnospiraceae bacterium]|nr:16S rRNA (guanine(966)-N(2))-methyltransferase RsmD [Lachnospiraceae bacterium]
MRVIAGTARSLRLCTVEGKDVRPTTDRIKETLFNMLAPYVAGSRFLDLFAGSGGIGIEALSRGADFAAFVDRNKAALNCIKANIKHTGFEDRSRVVGSDFLSAISTLSLEKKPFDIIFIDPPYDQQLEEDALRALASSRLVDDDTLIVVEASIDTDFSYLSEIGLDIVRNKEYKTNKHVFIKRAGADA